MEIDCEKLLLSLKNLRSDGNCDIFDHVLRLTKLQQKDIDFIVSELSHLVIDPRFTEVIGVHFSNILLHITTEFLAGGDKENFEYHQRKCIALSKIVKYCPDVAKYSVQYFTKNPAPFSKHSYTPKVKQTKTDQLPISDLNIVECCLNFLKSDSSYYKNAWNWSDFVDNFFQKGCDLQKFYSNLILAEITGMSQSQVNILNKDIPSDMILSYEMRGDDLKNSEANQEENHAHKKSKLNWNFKSDIITTIGDVPLPIFDVNNFNFFEKHERQDDLVIVESTKLNMRSLAMGVSSGKAICLSGPVGSGKTSMVEYLARATGRLPPKPIEIERSRENNEDKKCVKRSVNGTEKKSEENGVDVDIESMKQYVPKSGFLRIQLGDQTDSKMLLGQYRCTDTPGEFIWQPGVLTQAVMNGYWLLLEDLDSATQDVCAVLTNLLENNYLSVPGFRDCLRIEPGFQLFLTMRTQKSSSQTFHNQFTLLEKYLYMVNILPLSRRELCEIIYEKYPKLKTVASRIVDIYLTFSSGCHGILEDEIDENASKKHMENDENMLPKFQHTELTASSITNSGRLVSTRDLMKLCKRSHPSFEVTSSECAYFVFQNAVDIFCCHLPEGEVRNNLVAAIGGKIGIIKSRCDNLCDNYKPEIDVNDEKVIKIGRVEIERYEKTENDEFAFKKMKLDKNASTVIRTQDFNIQNKAPTFSFTKMATCLLERIAVSVQQNEPVLLVGETGVGKTSSIQYLSYQTHHKLVVVNMNNQSDVSDLIGGFKPVDLSFVVTPLRYEFESLFNRTFNACKNEKFLKNVSICFNRGEYHVLIKLMLTVVEKVFQRKRDEALKAENIYEKWEILKEKLFRLDSQLKNSVNISFAFIPGSLVNCIKNGDWVLLDEINLASTETLECLSTILEPDGSIILLEKGDFMPVKRHPNFRIFSCMNPNTDVGKKDLPTGIRNRFTEFFVDELTSENDLLILVNDYLCNTGINKTKILNTTKLYRRLRMYAQLELNDGLGNRPVFSLRTLCRALTICAKNLCGSIERNLYESFCLSFLTQLDLRSHQMVLGHIQKTLLTDIKQVISQQIPKPSGGEHLNFEGYWIEKGLKDVQECENYILTPSVKNNLKDLSRIISIGKLPVLLQGPTSAGKTSLIEFIAKRSGNVCLRINNHEHTDLQEYIGTYVADVTGKLTFKEGVLVQAMRNGYWIILDELNLAPSDILEALNRVLDDNRELFIPETQVVVKAHPNFMLFATQNPPGLYGGRKMLSRAFKNRFIELHFSDIPRDELEVILEKRCLIPKSMAQKMVKTMSDLQKNRRSTAKNTFTLRDLFRWGNRYTFADKTLQEDNTYDWNQHLIDEGYLVLSAKVRNNFETEIIRESLFTHFRKKISEENIFTLHENTSKVTKGILEKITAQTKYQNIVWTFDMRRMAVLTAKSLQFDEPVLLVGPTGCGKTTICQVLAAIREKGLRILNCHMHTEGADFLGGLRPYREGDDVEDGSSKQLFEWSDGPLILSMLEGGFFLADEISLAEDSVLERLNCVLEPERTLLLAEKGGVDSNASEFVITAKEGFQFLATMNPGGDFGKKELSPALRNRLTEIWCRPTDSEEDLLRIAEHSIKIGFSGHKSEETHKIAQTIIKTVFVLRNRIEKLNFSIRDVLAWVNFIVSNRENLTLTECLIFGLETVFLDALEMLPYETFEEIMRVKMDILQCHKQFITDFLSIDVNLEDFHMKKDQEVTMFGENFGIHPFYIEISPSNLSKETDFMFSAPTTQKNLFRLMSALSLDKAILLEGPPGVGKTSLVENLSRAVGYNIVRINLCEHTDLADLFGTDLPADDKSLECEDNEKSSKLGSFVWRDGPLLAALKAKNTWILLDELNLAPQSVLEGLNAVLDHRGEVYIAELNKTFKLGKRTRIFAAQNPLRQGGGRKGLPQSFLNRFTKVYLRKLEKSDLLHVINGKYERKFLEIGQKLSKSHEKNHEDDSKTISFFEFQDSDCSTTDQTNIIFDLAERMVDFSQHLENGISALEFGYKGGPFEVNLRDILRWCELLTNEETGYQFKDYDSDSEFLLCLYEKMKLVYCQRMRTETDKKYITDTFSTIFNCNGYKFEELSRDVGIYWTDDRFYLGDLVLTKLNEKINHNFNPVLSRSQKSYPLLLGSQMEMLRNLTECALREKPVILCGASDSGKTKLISLLCTLSNKFCNVDTIDDSVTGSFQQFDFNRHLEEVSTNIESILIDVLKIMLMESHKWRTKIIVLLYKWENYRNLNDGKLSFSNHKTLSTELDLFKKRLKSLQEVIDELQNVDERPILKTLRNILSTLNKILKNSETLNTGGHFEWVDSKIVKAIKFGQYICLEHVNLCSSAIIDRLNPVFEPNGALLVSEKGVNSNNESELIQKHQNFRAFLTMDPKNGEISRAMRNRCIEIAFHKECYSNEDTKKIIFENGVHDMFLINAILKIHEAAKSISEFNNFGISNILKFSFLVAQNQRMGMDFKKSLLISALEVYVRSSNTDLLGHGIEYYRQMLKNAINEEIKQTVRYENVIDYDCFVLKSNELTTFKLVRLQCEPFLVTLKCYLTENLKPKPILSNISSKFLDLKFDESILKYLLYFIYEMASMNDVNIRHLYLKEKLREILALTQEESIAVIQNGESLEKDVKIDVNQKNWNDQSGKILEYSANDWQTYRSQVIKQAGNKNNSDLDELKELLQSWNTKLAMDVKSSSTNFNQLPCNRKMFPRLRDYGTKVDLHGNKLSALLLARVTMHKIVTKKTAKLSQIDALAFSKALLEGIIAHDECNIFIKNLFAFMAGFEEFYENSIEKDVKQYPKSLTSILWINRLKKISQEKLFLNNSWNEKLIRDVILHFHWIQKHCFGELNCQEYDTDYLKMVEKLFNEMTNFSHPMTEIRKQFCKKYLNFSPRYDQLRVDIRRHYDIFDEKIELVPRLRDRHDYSEYKKRIVEIFHEKNIKIKTWFMNMVSMNFSNEVNFYEMWEDRFTGVNLVDERQFSVINWCNQQEIKTDEYEIMNNKFSAELLPIYEFFTVKCLTLMNTFQSFDYRFNQAFHNSIQSVGLKVMQLFNESKVEDYLSVVEKLLSNIFKAMLDLDKGLSISEILNQFKNTTNSNENFYLIISGHLLAMRSRIQYFMLKSLSVNNEICYQVNQSDDYETEEDSNNLSISGPMLTNNCLSVLLNRNGDLRSTGLGELPEWSTSLKKIKGLLWQNSVTLGNRQFDLQKSSLTTNIKYASKLIKELKDEDFEASIPKTEQEFTTNFMKLVTTLEETLKQFIINDEIVIECGRDESWFLSSMIAALSGAIEVNLITYLPLVDPVEKNRMKKDYTEEEIKYFNNILTSYEFMSITMNYNHLGKENKDMISLHNSNLSDRLKKLTKKVALRPFNNVYTYLAKDFNDFLYSCCLPNALLSLLNTVEECIDFEVDITNLVNNIKESREKLMTINETIKRIELWINNAEKFEYHTLSKYSDYYREFVTPIACAITNVKYGLTGLKHSLIMKRDSISMKKNGVYYEINKEKALSNLMKKFVEFPTTQEIDLFDEKSEDEKKELKINIYTLMEKIENSEGHYFRLIKSRLQEVQNSITLSNGIDADNFVNLDKLINICNQMWQKQEHLRRKKQEEEDSLYKTKSHCENENEDLVALQEISDMFPNYVDEDFSEFIQNDTLEQVIKIDDSKKTKKLNDTISIDDYKLICETFMYLMDQYSKSYYYNGGKSNLNMQKIDFIGPYKTKISIFHQLLKKYRNCLNSSLDESFYPGLSFLVGLLQDNYDDLELKERHFDASRYNFYKDSNISEVVEVVVLLRKVEDRVQVLLQEWPDHAVLKDILLILRRIYSLSSTSPIVRFNTGLQLLRKKIDEWNCVAHKLNNMRDLETDIANFVHKWMRMELQFWRECMTRTHDTVKSKACRYWFFMYNLLHEYLQSDSKSKLGNLLDYNKVEKCFGEDELIDEEPILSDEKVKIDDVIHVLKQFIESSNYAEYTTRLKILKSFEQYLMYLDFEDNKKKDSLIAILYNLHMYYNQFSAEIEEFVQLKRSPIEKKLKQFVKIESFNKDLSYFSMQNNISRVHRHLHKFLKEFETELKTRVTLVFSPKDAGVEINLVKNEKKNEEIFTLDVKKYIASSKLKEQYSIQLMEDIESMELLSRIDKLFSTSRNIVKETILHARFPSLIYNLDQTIYDQIETVEYLRCQLVDRELPKPKQKTQAKHILTQKRKALADFYKMLSTLGMSFKSGLVEDSIQADHVDLTIKPFLYPITSILTENLNLFYSKCVFKLKMLNKVMFQPNPDLGMINIERIKGFSTDLFLLVQRQRVELSKSVVNMCEFKDNLNCIKELNECLQTHEEDFSFEHLKNQLNSFKKCAIEARKVMEQFLLLLKCAPVHRDENLIAVEIRNFTGDEFFYQNSPRYKLIKDNAKLILDASIEFIDFLKTSNEFNTNEFVFEAECKMDELEHRLEELKELFKIENTENYYLHANSIIELMKNFEIILGECHERSTVKVDDLTNDDYTNIEIENTIHFTLLSMQNIYKKYTTKLPVPEDKEENKENVKEDDEESSLEPQHLKEKIESSLTNDLQTLNIRKIINKLNNLINSVKSNASRNVIKKLTRLIPILEQFGLLVDYYHVQLLGSHKVATKMLSVMLTVFIELGTKGFCIPKDLMDEEEKNQQEGDQNAQGFGFEDGEGEKDVSDKIESEDQLEDARKPGQEDKKDKDDKDVKEEKGIDMSEDFDSKLQDIDKPEDEDSDNEKSDEDEEMDKQMGETEEGAEKLDDQIWGDDEEKEENSDEEDMDEDEGQGSGEADDKHNNLDSEKDKKEQGEEEEGLDAVDQATDKSKKEKPKDIEDMENQEGEEEQQNPFHNELEEPPEPQDMELDNDFKLDDGDAKDNEQEEEQENPFDIDKMKDVENGMDEENGENEEKEEQKVEEKQEKGDSSDEENGDEEKNPEGTEKLDENAPEENEEEKKDDENPEQHPDETKNDEEQQMQEENEKKESKDFQQSKDKRTEEDRVESMPEAQNKGSNDQIANEKPETKQENELDEQDTGEDKEGVGQAENEQSESGHKGVAESKEAQVNKSKDDEKQKQEKRKQGNTDEERILGDKNQAEEKRLKTVDKMNNDEREDEKNGENEEDNDAEEYQHVKEAKQSDKTTLDNATEEQSKQVKHEENSKEDNKKDEENSEQLMDVDEKDELEDIENAENLESEKTDKKKDKAGKVNDPKSEKIEKLENVEVEGEVVETHNVPRGDETTAHTQTDLLNDMTLPDEPSTSENLEMHKMVEAELAARHESLPEHDNFETWQSVSSKMAPNARELCEQLRLILEPTKCTRLKGDYRTGRRINMKKIIPYIASQFRKDKIWLRRTKAAQRDYKITIAVDDSKSMDHNNSKSLTLQAISLVSQALTLLESGKLNVLSFGEKPSILLNYNAQFDGAKLVNSLNFDQNQSRIAELLDFTRTMNAEDNSSSDNGIFENLLIVLSDGRNIFSEGEKKVRNSVKLARLQRIFIVYVIIDNPDNKHSIMDIRVPIFSQDRKEITMHSYLDTFPFPYYVIVRDLGQLPLVLSDAMRQWFELVNSEQ